MTGDAPGAGGAGEAMVRREVLADLRGWGRRFPLFAPARFPAVAAITVAHLADRPRADRSLAGLMSLWLFAYDDLVDEGRLAGPDLARAIARYRDIATRGWAPGGAMGDPLGVALGAIARRLATRPAFAPLAPLWRADFARMLDAIAADRALSASILPGRATAEAGAALPTYEEWMARAQYSVGVHQHLTACLMQHDDPDLPARLPALRLAMDECARACRLANDLRTWGKERREGNFSTLAALAAEIRRAEPGLTPRRGHDRARRELAGRLRAHLARLDLALAASPRPNGAAEAGLRRFARAITGLYARHDFDTYAPPAPGDDGAA